MITAVISSLASKASKPRSWSSVSSLYQSIFCSRPSDNEEAEARLLEYTALSVKSGEARMAGRCSSLANSYNRLTVSDCRTMV